MEMQLLSNTKLILALLDQLDEGVVIHASDTSIIYTNTAASSILGLSKEEIFGKKASDPLWYFIDEECERLTLIEYPVNRVFNSEQNITHQLLGIHMPDESIRWVDVNATRVFDNYHGNVALIIFSDVTDRKRAYDEAALFKRVIETVDTGVTIADPSLDDCPLIYANRSFSVMTGYSNEEAIGKNCRYLQGKDREQEEIRTLHEAIQSGEACDVELKNYTKEGKLFYNLLTISPLMEKNEVKYFVGVQHNITRLKEQEQLLIEKNSYIQSILDAQEDMVLVAHQEETTYANQALLNFFGYETLDTLLKNESCISNHFIKEEGCFWIHQKSDDRRWIDKIITLESNQRIVCMSSKTKEKNYFQIVVKFLSSERYMLNFHNISANRIQEKILTDKAYHDPLTGVLNRRYFDEFVLHNSHFSPFQFTGIIMIDIDHFKQVNDTYGHSAGDKVLQQTVLTITHSVREKDKVIRWGGEEILVVVSLSSSTQLKKIAEKIRNAVKNSHFEAVEAVTVSIGASIQKPDEPIIQTIQRSDIALYKAKNFGRNRTELGK